MISRFSIPTQILLGPGAVREIPDLVRSLGRRRPLIVTDAGVVRAGLVERVTGPFRDAGLSWAVFDGVHPNPVEEDVAAGLMAYRDGGCDLVLALGGGSPLDAGKGIRLKVTHPLPLEDYEAGRGGADRIGPDVPPMIAVPTTAGTGSEVGRSAVFTFRTLGRKSLIFSPHLMPSFAVADPELTVGLPPYLTAATGMDALTHNLESYLSTSYHPICDAIARGGIRLVAQHLRRAVRCGADLDARQGMLMAAMMGATAFQKDLGAAHSLAHPLSTVAGVHHGLANAVVLPHVLAFNAHAAAAKLRDVAEDLGVEVAGLSDAAAARKAVDAVRALNREIGIPERLSQVGVTGEMIPELSRKAMEDGCHRTNPRPCTKEDMADLYRKAL
ncbi:MAG: iron-containing alcohol dehydrogenase [Candidatus Latescibacteria bacterium]|nr:iron-containing alcohol dehydrogenase [Candidatus Latescibacterota bacterium]